MKSYRDLQVYQLAKSLAIKVHKMSMNLPKYELYEEGSQIRRSSKSVGANIVEGYVKRNYKSDFLRSIIIAWAECDETIYHLEMLFETGSLTNENEFRFLKSEYEKLSSMLNKFYQSVFEKHISSK
ncbi:MAG: four helix bundle protein [Bacteroidales bacterium]|nr:four helix bundle protein [Bacteroidales bacterium]